MFAVCKFVTLRILVLFLWLQLPFTYGAQYITLTLKSENYSTIKCDNKPIFILKEGVPVKLNIEHTDYALNNVQCHEALNPHGVLNLKPAQQQGAYYEADIMNIRNTKFICNLYVPNYGIVMCEFTTEIKYMKSLKAYVNGRALVRDPDAQTLSDEPDVQTTYFYQVDEMVSVKCEKPKYEFGRLQFVHGTNKVYTSEAEPVNEIEFQMILRSEDYLSHVDCIFVKWERTTETILRIYMKLAVIKETNIIHVNDLIVRPYERTTLVYVYNNTLPGVICNGSATTVALNDDTTDRPDAEAHCAISGRNRTLHFYKHILCAGTRFMEEHYIEVIGGVLVVVMFLLLILALAILKRRKHALALSSEVDYVNLEQDNFITQLSRRVNDNANGEPTRQTVEYAHPANIHNEANPYSVPTNQNIEGLYAKPDKRHNIGDQDEGKYAEIVFKDFQATNKGKDVGNSEVIYAEVCLSGPQALYAKVKPKEDRNKEERSNDVEPAYCEVNALKRNKLK